MRRGQVLVILAMSSGMLSVLLAVAVNIATGGALPEPLDRVSWLAWPSVGLLAANTSARSPYLADATPRRSQHLTQP